MPIWFSGTICKRWRPGMLWNNDVEVFCASHQKITFLVFNGDCSFFGKPCGMCSKYVKKKGARNEWCIHIELCKYLINGLCLCEEIVWSFHSEQCCIDLTFFFFSYTKTLSTKWSSVSTLPVSLEGVNDLTAVPQTECKAWVSRYAQTFKHEPLYIIPSIDKSVFIGFSELQEKITILIEKNTYTHL